MNFAQFFRLVEKHGPWRLKRQEGRAYVRAKCSPDCPLTRIARKVTGKQFRLFDYVPAGNALGLSETYAQRIMVAADDRRGFDDVPLEPRLRGRLLKAARLA